MPSEICLASDAELASRASTGIEAGGARVFASFSSSPIFFRHDIAGGARAEKGLADDSLRLHGTTAGLITPVPDPRLSGLPLLDRYRQALERETRRLLDKDPSILWSNEVDDEGYPARQVQRKAEKIFEGANGRLVSRIAEDLIEDAGSLRTARDYVDGIRLDVRTGGGVGVRSGRSDHEIPGVAASFGLIALGNPRIEARATLPGGIRTRVELPLRDPGVRATLSRALGARMRGTLGLGVEDSGQNKWVSAGVEIRF